MQTRDLLQRITTDPDICHGKPVVRGLRYPVDNILELLAGGMTHEEMLKDYEDLTEDDILACEAYAKGEAADEEAVPKTHPTRRITFCPPPSSPPTTRKTYAASGKARAAVNQC